MSTPLLPRMVSLPAPPSTVSLISAARLPVAENESSPPFTLSTRFSVVPMSSVNGAGSSAVEAHARAVGGDGEDLGAVAAVDLGGVDVGAAFDQVGVVARVPDHAVVAGLAEHLVVGVAAGQRVVAGAAEQEVDAALAEQRVVAGLAEQLVAARAAGQRVVAGAAEQVGRGSAPLASSSVIVSLPPWPKTWISAVLATVGVPPVIGDGAAVDEDRAGRVAADLDVVVEVVADDRRAWPLAKEAVTAIGSSPFQS